jgi:hypothetical protein
MKAYIIGGGNSVTPQHYETLKNRTDGDIICTNFTFNFIKPDVLVWIDSDIYTGNTQVIDNLDCIKISRENIHYDGKDIHQVSITDVYNKPEGLYSRLYGGKRTRGWFTGCLAISSALALGYNEIYLLGYDGGAINGKIHHHDLSLVDKDAFSSTLDMYEPFRGLNITNLSPSSKIEVFKKDDLNNATSKNR